MRSLGLEDELIAKFTDAHFWLDYFPPLCKDDLKAIGAGIDWRRSFYTTPANPYYDKFVVWQFERLKEKNKLDYGKRYSIYSPMDGQPCMDHDRASGETVLPIEYTLIKLELLSPFPESLKGLEGKKVFLAAATLRPETMYGQTNCWILPTGTYGAYQINENEIFILSDRSAINLAYQEFSVTPFKTPVSLASVKGQDLIGSKVKAPLCPHEYVYVLPMNSISMFKGTGIVTSVPSDSPDDFTTLFELQSKDVWREKLGIKDEWVVPFKPIPILETEKGTLTAEVVCKELGIKSPNDRVNLAIAKEITYKLGFYNGKLIVGDYAGHKVEEAKDKVKQYLIDNNFAIKYAEPENEVISRSGDVCVVALTDQWFLNYGETEWKNQAKSFVFHSSLFFSLLCHFLFNPHSYFSLTNLEPYPLKLFTQFFIGQFSW